MHCHRLAFAVAAVILPVAACGGGLAGEPQKNGGSASEATRTYTFHGYTVTYPELWKLRDQGGTKSAQLYKPAGSDSMTAWWFFDRKPNTRKHTAEQIRDGMATSLAHEMKGFKLKGKGSLTIDGQPAAYVTFEHSVVDPPCVARQIFIPTGDGAVTIIAETAVATEWEAVAPELDRITRSIKLPK